MQQPGTPGTLSIADQQFKSGLHVRGRIRKSINTPRLVAGFQQVVYCPRSILRHLVMVSQRAVIGLQVHRVACFNSLSHLAMQRAAAQWIQPLVQDLTNFIMRKTQIRILTGMVGATLAVALERGYTGMVGATLAVALLIDTPLAVALKCLVVAPLAVVLKRAHR